MLRLVERRGWYFVFSLLLMLPGIIYMIWSQSTTGHPLPLSVDYTGGTSWEMRFAEPKAAADVRQVFVDAGYGDTSAFTVEDNRTIQVKLKNIDSSEKEALQASLESKFGPLKNVPTAALAQRLAVK